MKRADRTLELDSRVQAIVPYRKMHFCCEHTAEVSYSLTSYQFPVGSRPQVLSFASIGSLKGALNSINVGFLIDFMNKFIHNLFVEGGSDQLIFKVC